MKQAVLVFVVLSIVACESSTPVGPQVTSSETNPSMVASGTVAIGQTTQDFPFKRILCFGDSLTYGTTSRTIGFLPSLTAVEGYVPKLARLLSQEYGEGLELINSGIGGETSTEGVERLSSELRLYNPDLVLLLEGIVDVNSSNPRFPLVRANLNEMMRRVLRSGSQVIIATYPPLNPEGFRINGIENVPRLNDVIRQEAKQQDVLVADHESDWSGNMSGQGPDGLHPNDSGYEMMAVTWLNSIQELLEKIST
jgi:lysophospholipase L1-like esterase